MATDRVANPEMAEAWDGPEGEHWAAHAEHYEQVSWRHRQRLVEAFPIAATASVIDIGCGTGRSTRDLARVATDGDVLGIDLSSRMLERGRELAAAEGLDNVRFEQGDAQVHQFRPAAADLAVSAFGAMFFGDPVAAFSNIRGGLRAGGALALLTWRELARNEWLYALRDALALGRELPEPLADTPGPLGLADADRVRRILTDSGYDEVSLEPVDEPVTIGRDPDDAFAFISSVGFTQGMLQDLDSDQTEVALGNVRQLLGDRATADGVLLGSSAWLVTARVPA
jgi:SAM-dependent methyltransferase